LSLKEKLRFLADMGVSTGVVAWLRKQGYDAVHLAEQGLERSANGEIFAKAARERRIVLTFDLDFGEIVAMSHGTALPVVVFRLRNTRAPHVIDRLAGLLDVSGAALASASVIVVEESRYRMRKFPPKT